MNPNLESLHAYPFERLDALKSPLSPNAEHPHISLALGEPKHEPPDWIVDELTNRERITSGLGAYPATRGMPELREAISAWLQNRFGVTVDASTQILPVNGTREGLFSFGQAVLSGSSTGLTLIPNPFYQIYEGSCLLRGSNPYYVPGTVKPNIDSIPVSVLERAELLYLCTPNNPSGSVFDLAELMQVVELAQQYDFVVASDECYSEIYMDEGQPPPGLLQAAFELGLTDFHNCIAFNSLSKRSNCPGLRSGFAVGDAKIMSAYYHYRTYHGCAMPVHVQEVSTKLWRDEAHVVSNREIYRKKFHAIQPMMKRQFDCELPSGAFYYWPDVQMNDERFAKELFVRENITVLPGQYLSRTVNESNPGKNRIRIALVAPYEACIDAVRRLCNAHAELVA